MRARCCSRPYLDPAHCSRQRCQPPEGDETCSHPLGSFRMAWPPTQDRPERRAASEPRDGSWTTSLDGPGLPARRASSVSVCDSKRSQYAFMRGWGWLGQRYCSQLNGVVPFAMELCAGLGDAGSGLAAGPVAERICCATHGVAATSRRISTPVRISISAPVMLGGMIMDHGRT